MQKTRRGIMNLLANIERNKEQYVSMEKDIISFSSQNEYKRSVNHYDYLIAELKKELQTFPIGYRYTGVYFLKKPYTMPPEFIEGSGSLYMRENLVSWQIEKEPGVCDYPYYRTVYDKPFGKLITKEDAVPVYPKEQ